MELPCSEALYPREQDTGGELHERAESPCLRPAERRADAQRKNRNPEKCPSLLQVDRLMELYFKYLDAMQVADKKIEGEKHVSLTPHTAASWGDTCQKPPRREYLGLRVELGGPECSLSWLAFWKTFLDPAG